LSLALIIELLFCRYTLDFISKASVHILLGPPSPPTASPRLLPDRNNTSAFFFTRPTSHFCTLQPDFD
jgi:hypothetical protein